jgi:hypothetical protein
MNVEENWIFNWSHTSIIVNFKSVMFPEINTHTLKLIYHIGLHILNPHTVKTGVSFRHSLRHRNSASASVVSTLKSVCLSGKTTLKSVKTTLWSVKTTLTLSYRVLEMTLWSAEIKSHSKVSKRHSKSHFQHSIR